MRNHGWQPPFHPLQTVAIVVFSALAFSFYVFFAPFLGTRTLKFVIIGVFTPLVGAVFALYIACTWIDPADPGVHRAQERYNPTKPGSPVEEESRKTLKTFLATHEEGYEIVDNGCQPLTDKFAEKSCCKRKREHDEIDPDEQSLYCSICDAEISIHSKHCRACDKCVHGFDHHCRWLNNCVGTRNYKPFVALMVTCLLMLVLEWTVGIVVLVRCFNNKTSFQKEIVDNLGRSFPRVAFIGVLIFLTFLALLATAPLTQLFCFHLILMHKGMTTYDYILAVREQNQESWDEAGGLSSMTTTPATSTETGFSGYNTSAGVLAGKRTVFCTPPRMFVDQDQTIMALSDLEVGVGKVGKAQMLIAKPQSRAPVGLNPWKLARVRTADAASAAARARQKSSILLPHRPGLELTLSTDSESSFRSSLGSSGEIQTAPASRRGRRKFQRPGLRRELWSLTRSKRDRITPLSDEDMFARPEGGMHPLSLEPRSPYRSRSSSFSGDPRASYPPGASYPPPHVLFPRYPGDEGGFYPGSSGSGAASQVDSPMEGRSGGATTKELVIFVDGLRTSVNSDGYEASCGSADDASEANGQSQSWNRASWSKFSLNNAPHATPAAVASAAAAQVPAAVWGKEENVKPWVTFTAGTVKPDAKDSPGWQSVSSGSRVEANILKVKPELLDARMMQTNNSPSSPSLLLHGGEHGEPQEELRESSDFLSSDTSTSYGETPDRGSMSSFFYQGPALDAGFKATSERHLASNRRLMNSILGSRSSALSRNTDDPKLLVDTA